MNSSPSGVTRYRMLSAKDNNVTSGSAAVYNEDSPEPWGFATNLKKTVNRETWVVKIYQCISRGASWQCRYLGSLIFNLGAFIIPALYGTLSKLWIANIDSSKVVTTDVYTYIGVIVEVLNEGLPRTAWLIIGDKANRSTTSRIGLTYTLITVQMILGVLLMVIFISIADRLASVFVPIKVRRTSLAYVRISSVQAISSALDVSVSTSIRALDHPDVPLVISSTKLPLILCWISSSFPKFMLVRTRQRSIYKLGYAWAATWLLRWLGFCTFCS